MFFLLVLLTQQEVFKCEAGFYEDAELRSLTPQTLENPRVSDDLSTQNQPLRVYFDVSSIDDPSLDEDACIQLSSTCPEGSVLSAAQKNVIKSTMNTIAELLHSKVNVTVQSSSINLQSKVFKRYEPNIGVLEDYDLYVAVMAEYFGEASTGLAYATAVEYDTSARGRPNMGYIVFNTMKVPTEKQDLSSGNRQFFLTALHELNHVLSFSAALFPHWSDSNGNPYQGPNAPVVSDNNHYEKYDYEMKRLTTPALSEFVNKRFSVKDPLLMNLGLELEDGGGSGTSGSHPSARLFFTDLMQGRTYGPGFVSEIFISTLADSGWYNPDPTFFETMMYLSNAGERVIVDPPVNSFPSDTLCSDSSYTTCFYDRSFKGVCGLVSKSSINSLTDKQKSWVNPKDSNTIGQDDLLDYAPVILPSTNCRDSSIVINYGQETAEVYGESLGNDSICALSTLYKSAYNIASPRGGRCFKSWCGTDNRIRLIIMNKEYLCKEDGETKTVDGYGGRVTCPPFAGSCANRARVKVLNVLSIFPDRGPLDGGNLVTLSGFGFDEYDSSELKLRIGSIELAIILKKDSYILAKIPKGNVEERKSLKMVPQTLYAISVAQNVNSSYDSMYTFTDRRYSAGSRGFSVSSLLIAISLLISGLAWIM